MPEISSFYGIQIKMYFNDHLPPHFHAVYGDDEVLIGIPNLTPLAGRIPMRAQRLVLEWAELHGAELLVFWNLARAQQPLGKIDPIL